MKQPDCFAWLNSAHTRQAFGFAWSFHALCAVGLALPLASVLHSHVKTLPGAERSLLAPGGYLLGEALRLSAPALDAATEVTVLGFGVAALLRVIPLTGLVVALRQRTPLSARAFGRRLLLTLPEQIKLTLASACIWLLVVGAGLLAESLVARAVGFDVSDRTHDLLRLGLKCLLVSPSLLVQPITDLSRFSSSPGIRTTGGQLTRGLEIFTRQPGGVFLSYLGPQVLGYTFALAAAWGAHQLALAGPEPARDWLGALIHLAGLTALLVGRVCWLACAEQWTARTRSLADNT
jgi:hypothetical protein